ncbi:ABC transporter permease [Lactobacillus ultunensis]|uniref:Bacterial ABC transporter protein EcsB n=1 Tax=Lactobacillus ultunensis DSM 16047 TaxID=525365 RepID=C2EL29_9LACO|nr:ABC transporter permease [Lactobacillus ultunensis]EEJ72775.1 bacterial ABC transporter protein EcsB [Lactobacillus ultunensis DSM 16047]KRL83025.1 ABC superfamily ATP binding cassette transporter permease protein [Lactobacillus ultunensis DSM 16047]QQP29094.1 ABC transporter permease [Lactobacillus ultunensis]
MRELAKKRLNENLKQSIKYLTLVFNDFFILALIFLVGALMFWYAEAMKTMPSNLWFYKPLVGFILWLPLLTGRLVTLIKEADMQFLFTQDEQMKEYLKPMYRYSLTLPFILEILLAGIVFPFATIKAGVSVSGYVLLVIAMLFIKAAELDIEENNLHFGKKIGFLTVSLVALVVALISAYYPIFGDVLGVVAIVYVPYFSNKKNKQLFDWRYAVENEKARKDRVYSIFSMFTDVQEKQVNIKRRKYLDFLLPRSIVKENPNLFLYRRSLLRNPEYLNLLVRMTVFAILISWLVQDWRWALGLSCLVIFLTVYQLLPMATEFDRNFMYRVYPIERRNRGKDLVKVLTLGLFIQWLLISVCWLIVLPINLNLFEAVGILLVFTALVTAAYLPNRVKKMNQKNFGIR